MANPKELFEIAESTDRDFYFVPVFHDFLDSDVLNGKEKIVYIMLKRYLKFGTHNGTVYPSLNTLCKQLGMTKPTVIKVLKSLQTKKVLKIEQRGLNKPNLYTLYDTKKLWKSQSMDDVEEAIEEEIDRQQIERLEQRGYFLKKEKELASTPTTAIDTSPIFNQYDIVDNIAKTSKSQEHERYSIEQIKELYSYDFLVDDQYISNDDVNTVINILYDTLNCRKSSIRINGEDKPTMVVFSKLLKIGAEEIKYSIAKYHEQTDRIKNVNAYLLTILYHSKEQAHLDLMNLGHTNGDF